MLNELVKTKNKKNRTRVGRGPGSKGKTGGRGHKGQKSRSGGGVPILFEGGQSNFVLRTPKRGFRNYNRKDFDILNVGTLNKIFAISQATILLSSFSDTEINKSASITPASSNVLGL